MKPCYIAKSSKVAARELGNQVVVMSAVNSTLFTLNDVASLIWRHADGMTSLEEIIEKKVCAEFDVDPAVALADAERFVTSLAEHGVLVLGDAPMKAGTEEGRP